MTHAELQAIRDVTPYFGQREEIRDGERVMVPVATPEPGGDWFVEKDTDPLFVTDANGVEWRLGWLNWERVRRRW